MTTSTPSTHHTSLNQLKLKENMVLAINKPLYWTSFDVVKKLRSIVSKQKVGHAGTLDPLATGLLLICTGSKTKVIDHYQALEKVYKGEMVLGKTTPSVDLETAFDSETSYKHITEEAIYGLIPTFLGNIEQTPPTYSAVKIHGIRAYKKARQGQKIILSPRQVFIRSFVITSIKLPHIQFQVTCGKGTYIRSIVQDFGKQLGVGAYLNTLCRTRIGAFKLEDAYDMVTLTTRID